MARATLGADDKSGIAGCLELIMVLAARPEVTHPTIEFAISWRAAGVILGQYLAQPLHRDAHRLEGRLWGRGWSVRVEASG